MIINDYMHHILLTQYIQQPLRNIGLIVGLKNTGMIFRNYKLIQITMEPWYNEDPRDWQNLFATSRFFSTIITITAVKKIIR